METSQLKIDGMSCGSCVDSVTRALLKVPDVRAVEIDLPRGAARVTTEGAAAASLPAMVAALGAAGYEAGPLASSESVAAPASGQGEAQGKTGGCGQGGGARKAGGGGCCCH